MFGRIFSTITKKYWKYRQDIINNTRGDFRSITDKLKLLYIKRCDVFNNASLGTHIGFGAQFKSRPAFPHGLYGLVISHNAIVGKGVTIYHNVTIGEGKGGAPVIGDNVYIGTGTVIIGKVRIGNNVRIGAGTIVTCDIPDNATVVMETPRIIIRGE